MAVEVVLSRALHTHALTYKWFSFQFERHCSVAQICKPKAVHVCVWRGYRVVIPICKSP